VLATEYMESWSGRVGAGVDGGITGLQDYKITKLQD